MSASHYCCGNCAEIFERNEAIGHYVSGDGFATCCPHCDSEQLDDCFMCELCGIRRATEEGTDMCAVCYALNEAEQDANVARCKELEKELNKPFHDWTESRESEFHDYFTNV
jgi:hypothetical protein